MTAAELIEAIKNAETKIEVEALVVGFPDIVIDKRKSLGTLKDDVLDFLEGQAGTVDGDTKRDEEQLSLPALDVPAPQNGYDAFMNVLETMQSIQPTPQPEPVLEPVIEAQKETLATNIPEVLPDIDDGDEDEPEAPVIRNRTLRNTKTGNLYMWTPALAALPHLEEI